MSTYANQEGLFFDNISMAAANTSEPFDAECNTMGAVQLQWTGADATDGYVHFEVTTGYGIDNATDIWDDLINTEIYLTTAAGSCFKQLPIAAYKKIRAVYNFGSNTAGTLRVRYIFKSHRG